MSESQRELWWIDIILQIPIFFVKGWQRWRRSSWGREHNQKEGGSHFQWHVQCPLLCHYCTYIILQTTKKSVSKKWSKQPKFLNPHQQDHQAHHRRWFEGRTHGERRRPRRTRTPMMPMTPLDNKPLGRLENDFLQYVQIYDIGWKKVMPVVHN